jgi:hypothetical protein
MEAPQDAIAILLLLYFVVVFFFFSAQVLRHKPFALCRCDTALHRGAKSRGMS